MSDSTRNTRPSAVGLEPGRALRQMANKVPEITLYFWIIKVLCTTVGETAADYLNQTLKLGLTGTTIVMSVLLLAALVFQFRARRYIPALYWLSVVLISVVGTLITDNLTDHFGVSLVTSTVVFSVVLAIAFASWYASEKSLSIHTIVTTRREAFYWTAVLFTFALGTAGGDLLAERLGIGYWKSALIFGGMIGLVYLLHRVANLNAIASFWIVYILTRPLGASIGDYLSQAKKDGGLALGTTTTSFLFLGAILVVVVYLTVTKKDLIDADPRAIPGPSTTPPTEARVLVVTNKVGATPALIEAVRERAAASPARFFLLVPNPKHVSFDRVTNDTGEGEHLLEETLPQLEQAAGTEVPHRVAKSPNAFDDITDELRRSPYDEIILETPPSHLSHRLHVELPQRIAHLGYPLTTIEASH